MFLKTVPKSLNILALSALAILSLKIFFLDNFPEFFNGAYKFGLITEGILVSILASYVFYLIVVHMKEINDKKAIYPHVIRWAKGIVSTCKAQLNAFSKESGVDLQFNTLTRKELNEAFAKINPKDISPLKFLNNNRVNWYYFFTYYMNKSKKNNSKIMSQLKFLDAKLVALTTQIDECAHFIVIDGIVNVEYTNEDLSSFSRAFYEYYEFCFKLDKYLQDELNEFEG